MKGFFRLVAHAIGLSPRRDFTSHDVAGHGALWKSKDEWSDTQLRVATEAALVATVDLVTFQRDMWNDLVDAVVASGMSVTPSDEAKAEYAEIIKRFSAALTVVGEVVNMTEDDLRTMMETHKEMPK